MIATFVCMAALSQGPEFVTPRVIAATAFRNGYGFVLKEITIPESGEVYVKDLDFPVNGTFWFAPGEGTSVSSVRMTYVEEEEIKDEAGTINDILLLNVGRPVELGLIRFGETKIKTMKGTLRAISERTVTLESGGKVQMIPREWVQTVTLSSSTGATKMTTKVRTPVLHVKGRGGSKGTLYTVGLLRGLSWSPAYYLDISDPKTVKLTMKANVINNVADFENIELGMVSGFPEVSQLNEEDPLTTGVRKIFELSQRYSQPPSAFPDYRGTTGGTTGGFGGGGLGGTREGGFVPRGITSVAFDPTDNSLIVQGAEKAIRDLEQQISASQVNDLFVYTTAGMTLKRMDRCYLVIQESEAEYEYRYVADTGLETAPVTVIKSLVFTNKTQLPWTDAPAMMVNKGRLVGQSPMPYTVVGDEAEVRIGRATTVHVVAKSEEVGRELSARTISNSHWDLVKMRDTVTVTNLDPGTVIVRVRRTVNGRVTASSDNGSWKQSPVIADGMNTVGNGQWEVELKPGEKKDLTVEYENFVRIR